MGIVRIDELRHIGWIVDRRHALKWRGVAHLLLGHSPRFAVRYAGKVVGPIVGENGAPLRDQPSAGLPSIFYFIRLLVLPNPLQ